MPRPAAVILGLALVAFSIGFNAKRYPVVWDMVNLARGDKAAQAADATECKESEPSKPAATPSDSEKGDADDRSNASKEDKAAAEPAIKPIKVDPEPEVGKQVVMEDCEAPSADPPAVAESAAEVEKSSDPLVPVTKIGARQNASGLVIRRLPPVHDAGPARNWSQFVDNRIPIYPSTGLQ